MITGIVLCGGASRRFGGQEKPLLSLRGTPLIEQVLTSLEPQVDEIIISANGQREAYQRYGHRVVADAEMDLGPLAGIAAAASVASAEVLFVCPGDSPFLPSDLVGRLEAELADSIDAVAPWDGERLQHLFLLLRRKATAGLGDYLADGGRSVHQWLDQLRWARCKIEDRRAFTNINSPEDLERLEQDSWHSPAG